jgi:hypothetical protein
MKKVLIILLTHGVCVAFGAVPTLARTPSVMGVNVMGIQEMSEEQQDVLMESLLQNGVKTVRTGFGQKFNRFIIRSFERGIGAVAIVYPTEGATGPMRPAAPAVGLQWAVRPLSESDPKKFGEWFTSQLALLEAAGVRLTALELGNEINGPFFNGDFLPAQASGRILGISDLNSPNDLEGRAIAASYRAYIQVMSELKDRRDHSKVNHATPILSAGLADGGLPGKRPGQRLDGVSIPATLEFLRQNGIDKLVDGYAIHLYPNGNPDTPLPARIDVLKKDVLALCTAARPCWLTEWNFNNPAKSCPLDDEKRVRLVQTERKAFQPFVAQGRLVAALWFMWGSDYYAEKENQGAILRCGALTEAGKLALSPM